MIIRKSVTTVELERKDVLNFLNYRWAFSDECDFAPISDFWHFTVNANPVLTRSFEEVMTDALMNGNTVTGVSIASGEYVYLDKVRLTLAVLKAIESGEISEHSEDWGEDDVMTIVSYMDII